MASFNRITIVGYCGRDVELRYTPQGTAVASTSIATTEKRGDQEFTTWFKLTFWGKQAELANEYLSKGKQVYVSGTLRQEEYTDREGGERTSLVVNVSEMQFLSSKSDSADSPARTPQAAAMNAQAPSRDETEEDMSVPF